MNTTAHLTRTKHLAVETRTAHAGLDSQIMAYGPFESLENYARFLTMQYRLHQTVDSLYLNPSYAMLLPDLRSRRRLSCIVSDMIDLNLARPDLVASPLEGHSYPATGLGWLYVVEGSTLGAAILSRLAAGLGLDGTFGASHLAPPAGGRASRWKPFVEALDSAELDANQDRQLVAGAKAAFTYANRLIRECFA